MARIASHGGNCCGMKHISGFRDLPETNVRQLIEKTSQREYGDGQYQLEVILSDRQTRDNPGLIEQLARLGYVYTSSWSGQHGTPVHLFLRAKHRLALSTANFYGRWTGDLNGMLPHPSLDGSLPALAEQPTAAGARAVRGERHHNYLLVGDRVRVNSPRSQLHGQERTIRGFYYSYNSDAYYGIFEDQPRGTQIVVSNLVKIEQPAAPVAPPPPPTVYRHPTNPLFPAAAEARLVAAAEARLLRTIILSQFYCVFRATGQASRVFATLAEAQAAYPQALDWHERKVYSDGEVVEGPVNHG